jgi:hypothetical protein
VRSHGGDGAGGTAQRWLGETYQPQRPNRPWGAGGVVDDSIQQFGRSPGRGERVLVDAVAPDRTAITEQTNSVTVREISPVVPGEP